MRQDLFELVKVFYSFIWEERPPSRKCYFIWSAYGRDQEVAPTKESNPLPVNSRIP